MTLPRFALGILPTPLVRAHRLESALGCGPVLVKRDDLIGFAGAGNKTRALELLLGAAVDRDCDVFVTGGSPGSNFVHAAACAARVAGMDCDVLVSGTSPLPRTAGLALAAAAGARIVTTGDPCRDHLDEAVQRHAQLLREQGRRPLAVPRGGSTPLGAVGFAYAVAEVAAQLDAIAMTPARLVVALGSGGTTAGLLAGLALHERCWPVAAVSVSRPPDQIKAHVLELARRCADIIGAGEIHSDLLEVVDARDPAHGGIHEPPDEQAAFGLHTEGFMLDPVYSARSFATALDLLRSGAGGPLLYWHTGGLVPSVAQLVADHDVDWAS